MTSSYLEVGSRVFAKYPPYRGKKDNPWFYAKVTQVTPNISVKYVWADEMRVRFIQKPNITLSVSLIHLASPYHTHTHT
jgi:hypothetical protein